MKLRRPRPLHYREELVLQTCEEELRHVRRCLEDDGVDDRYIMRLFRVETSLSDLSRGEVRGAEDVFVDSLGRRK